MQKRIVLFCVLTLVLSIGCGSLAGYLVAKGATPAAQTQQQTQSQTSTPPSKTEPLTDPQETTPQEVPVTPDKQGFTVADIADFCKKSVVNITVKEKKQNYTGGSEYTETVLGHGTGVIIRNDGYIATCHHVVDGADIITVTLDDQTEYPAELVGHDERFDLAVIRVTATDLPAVALGDSDTIRSGEQIVVIGNPLGEFGSSVTAGVLSAPARELTIAGTPLRLMQIDAAVNPGNSGGALLNMRGELIGIVNAKVSASGIEGIAFAIPWNSIKDKVDSIITSGNTGKKAVLGVSTKAAVCYIDSNKVECVEITAVRSESAAESAGLKVGDYLISADGKNLKSNDDLTLVIKYHSPGDQVVFQVYRNGKQIEIIATLGES